jgi:hypothetical protein
MAAKYAVQVAMLQEIPEFVNFVLPVARVAEWQTLRT